MAKRKKTLILLLLLLALFIIFVVYVTGTGNHREVSGFVPVLPDALIPIALPSTLVLLSLLRRSHSA